MTVLYIKLFFFFFTFKVLYFMMVLNLPDSYAILLKMNTSLPETLTKRLANLAFYQNDGQIDLCFVQKLPAY